MPSRPFQKGAASKRVYFRAWTAADGLPKTDLAWNTASFTINYVRNGAAATAITLATQTAGGAWTSGGFVVVTSNLYRLDIPDAALAAGVDSVEIVPALTGIIFEPCSIDLTVDDPNAAGVLTGDPYALLTATPAELAALPAQDGVGYFIMLQYLYQRLRNRRKTTATLETLYKKNSVTALATAVVSDDTVTYDHAAES